MAQAPALNTMPEISPIRLPRTIKSALGKIGRRLQWVTFLQGLGSLLVLGTIIMVVGMALDFAVALPVVVRLLIWGSCMSVVSGLSVSTIRSGLRQRRSESALELAGLIEKKFPNVGELLTASVGLIRDGLPPNGSPALIAALVDQAATHVEAINPLEAVPSTTARRRFALGLTLAILVGIPVFLVPDPLGKLAARFLNPWADLGRISRIKILVEPGDAYAAIGDDFTVSAEVQARFGPAVDPENVWLEWNDPATKRVRRVAMDKPASDSSAVAKRTAVIPSLTESLSYRVVVGSTQSDRYAVTAVEPPKIAKLAVKVVPPTYTKRSANEFLDARRVEAFEMSRVELTVTADTRIKAVELFSPKPGGQESETNRTFASVASDGRTGTVSFFAETSGPFSIRLHDPRGIASRPEKPRRIKVIPDTAPTVDLQGIDGLKESNANDTLRVGVVAGDDVAVASVQLHYKITRQGSQSDPERGQVESDLKGLGTETAKGVVALGLRSLNLKPGDALNYRVRVADNRPAPRGPNVTWSSDHDLSIVEQAQAMATKRGEAERSMIQERLEAFKKAITDTKKETEQLRYAADAAQRNNGNWEPERQKSLTQQEAEARQLEEKLQVFADELKESSAYHPLARPAEEIAQVEGEALRTALDRARQAADPAKRFNALQKADARAADLARKVDELKTQFDALNLRGQERDRLQELADRQAEIAEHAEKAELNPRDRLAFDKLQAEQNAVKKDLDQLLQKSPELRAELLRNQAEEAKGLVEKAKALAERQREEAANATNLSEKSTREKLQEIAQEQRVIENEARRFGLDVNQALAENGRSPLNAEPLKRAVEPIERGDVNEGREAMRQAERELLRVAHDIEDAPQDTKALARRLFNAEQALTNDLAQVLGENRNKTEFPAEARAAVQEALKRLRDRAADIAQLAAAIPESKDALAVPVNGGQAFPRDLAVKAADSAKRTAEQLRLASNPQAMEKEAVEAREALGALANALPDRWKTDGETRKTFDEARAKTDAAANEVDKHLRETDRPNDGQKAIDDLVTRLAPVIDQAKQAAEQLGKVETPPRQEAQRNLAVDRANQLAAEVEAARKALAAHPGAKEARAIRDRLNMAVVESKVATERLSQSLAGASTDEKLADALAAEANNPEPGDPLESKRMASAIRNVQAADAPIELAEAVRAAGLASAVPADRPDAAKALNEEAKQAIQELADRLNGRQTPRGKVEALARAERGSVQERDPVAAAKLQRVIAAELAGLPAGNPENQAAIEAVQNAEAVAEAVAKPAEPGETPRTDADLAKAQTQAAKALDALAAKLPDQPAKPAQPAKERPGKDLPVDRDLELNAEQAKAAAELAVRERHLAERLQTVLGERAEPQQALKREAVALSRDLASLRDRVQAVSDRARWPAQEAASLLGDHASPAMNEAANQLGLGQKDSARNMQRQAADLAERAARSTEDMANALLAETAALDAQALADAANVPTPEQAPLQGEALAKARDAMNQAAAKLQEARTAASQKGDTAKQAIREAAKTLQAAAESQAQAKESTQARLATPRAGSAKDPKGREITQGTTETLADLKSLVQKKTGRSWGELPGHLRSEILEMARQPRYRDDYARLIQLYFREIASGAK